jgi:hypothetical protein
MAPPPTGTSSRSGPAPPQTLVRSFLLGIWTMCSSGPDQLFVPNGISGTIQWSSTSKVRWRGRFMSVYLSCRLDAQCLDTTDGVLADGTPVRPLPCFPRAASDPDPQIQLWDCDSTNRNQQWFPQAESHPKSCVPCLLSCRAYSLTTPHP